MEWTCDNCPYRGCHEFPDEWYEPKYVSSICTGLVIGDRTKDACFFNPVPVECPPQNWCGRHPRMED